MSGISESAVGAVTGTDGGPVAQRRALSPAAGGDVSELFERWHRHGDSNARDQLVSRFLPLARKLARRYTGASEPFEDLMQVASLGLVNAIDRFDPGRGVSFASFAVPTILGELKRYFRDSGWSAHVPRGAKELALKVQRVQQRLAAQTGCSPSVSELAEFLELSVEEVVEALEAAAAHHASSLDAVIRGADDEPVTLADALGEPEPGFEIAEAVVMIRAAAPQLSALERRVLALRFFEDQTQSVIAEQIGVSQMQVSRILRRALSRIGQLTEGGNGE